MRGPPRGVTARRSTPTSRRSTATAGSTTRQRTGRRERPIGPSPVRWGPTTARRTREEYLAKFKADALAASGALFDLGLAYEANGLWREAIGAYDDYLTAVGKEGETVQWTFSAARHTGIQGASIPFPAVSDGNRIHLSLQGTKDKPGFWWVTLDAATGVVLQRVSLLDALALQPTEASVAGVFAADPDRVYVYWHRVLGIDADGNIHGNTWFGDPWVAALSLDGRQLWKVRAGSEEEHVAEAFADRKRLCIVIASKNGSSEGLLLDAAEGRSLDRFALGNGTYDLAAGRFVPPYFDKRMTAARKRWEPNVRYATGRPGITFSVSEGTRLSERDENAAGVRFYQDDKPVLAVPRMQPVFKDPPLEGEDLPLVVFDGVWKFHQVFPKDWSISKQLLTEPPTESPSGIPGVTVFGWGAYTRIFKDARQVLRLPRSGIDERPFTAPLDGWLVLKGADGAQFAVNPDGWQPLTLYEDSRLTTAFLAQDDEYLLFSLRSDPARGGVDRRYGVSTTEPGTVLNLVSKSSRAIVAKHFLKELKSLTLVGHDPVVIANNTVSRLKLAHRGQIVIRSAAETHLRRAACLAEAGDDAAAGESLARFEAEVVGDPRSAFLRMNMAARRGDRTEAGRQGLRAMASGGLSEEDLRACLAAVRIVRPEVRDALATPVTSRLLLRSLAAPGVLVAAPEGPRERTIHLVVDTVRRTSSVVPTPEFSGFRLVASAIRRAAGVLLARLRVAEHGSCDRRTCRPGWRRNRQSLPGIQRRPDHRRAPARG